MPQFDTTFLFSQVFWMLVSFGVLYLGISSIIFPLYERIFEKRNKVIQEPLEKAENLLNKIKKIQDQIEQKKQQQEKRNEKRVQQMYQTAFQHLEKEVQKTDKRLMHSLKRKVQKMNIEEKKILNNSSGFVTQILK